MSRATAVGDMQSDTIALALFRAYVDAHDHELTEWGVTREDILALAREYIGGGYSDGKLATIADQIIKAFVAGRKSQPAKT